MQQYNKAIAGALTGAVGLIATVIPGIEEYASPEFIHGLSVVLATAAVFVVRNKES